LAITAMPSVADTLKPLDSAPPQTVDALWADFDPRAEPLETQVVREWKDGDITLRYVIYTAGTFKGEKSRIAAFYAFPTGQKNLPAIMHMHGGGQRANLRLVTEIAKRGYASLSVKLTFPQSPKLRVVIDPNGGMPRALVDVDTSRPTECVDIYYGYERDPRVRYYDDARAVPRTKTQWMANCPVFDLDEPLFVPSWKTWAPSRNTRAPPSGEYVRVTCCHSASRTGASNEP
jgi:hypothetical protein